MRCHQSLSADVHCQDLTELEEAVGRGRSIDRHTTWAENLARVWKEKASEQIEASVFVLRARIQILRSMQRMAVEKLLPVGYRFRQAKDDYETELQVRRQRFAESPYWKRCCPQNSCHHQPEKDGDDTATAGRPLQVPTHSRSFLRMCVLNLSHYHSLLRLFHSAAAVVPGVLPW